MGVGGRQCICRSASFLPLMGLWHLSGLSGGRPALPLPHAAHIWPRETLLHLPAALAGSALSGQPGFCSRCPQSSQHPHALDSTGLCHLTVTVLSKHRASAPERQAPLSAAAGEEGGHTNTPMERLHSGERYVVICFCLTKKSHNFIFQYKKQ